MSVDVTIAALMIQAAAHRARAEQARGLAEETNNAFEQHALRQHAESLDHLAEELTVQAAVLREGAREADPEQDIAALRPFAAAS